MGHAMVTRHTARARRGRSVAATVFLTLVLIYLFAPVVVTVLFSLTTSARLSLPIEGFTLEWYSVAIDDPLFMTALRNSALLALTSGVFATALGTTFALGIVRIRSRWRGTAITASLVPAAVPALVFGVALASLFLLVSLPQGLLTAGIGQAVVCLPFVILTLNARLQNFDFSVLEAARDLGASPLRTFRDITFPLIRPSVFGAALLAMALSLDEFVVTWFNIGNDQTLPVLIWGMLRKGVSPSINALATMILAALVILVVLSSWLSTRSKGSR